MKAPVVALCPLMPLVVLQGSSWAGHAGANGQEGAEAGRPRPGDDVLAEDGPPRSHLPLGPAADPLSLFL